MVSRSVRARRSVRLPDRFPEGTKYVVESTPRRDYVRRFIEYPDGRRLDLGTRPLPPCCGKPSAKPCLDKAAQRNVMQPSAPMSS
jgi:hypothetical protein